MAAKNIYNVPAQYRNTLSNDEKNNFNYQFLWGVQNKDIKYSEIFNPTLIVNQNAWRYLERLPSHAYTVSVTNGLVRVTDPVTGIPRFYRCHTWHTSWLTFVATNRTETIMDNYVDVMSKDTTSIANAYARREYGMVDYTISWLALNQFVTDQAIDINAQLGMVLYDGTDYFIYMNLPDKIGTFFTITDNYDWTYTWDILLNPITEAAANIDLTNMWSEVWIENKWFIISDVGIETFTLRLPNVLTDEEFPPLVYDATSTFTVSDGTNEYIYTDLTTQLALWNIVVAPGAYSYPSYEYTLVNDPLGNSITGFNPNTAGWYVIVSLTNWNAALTTNDNKNIKTYRDMQMKQAPIPGIVTGTVGSELNTGVSVTKKFIDVVWNDLIKQTYHRVKNIKRFNI